MALDSGKLLGIADEIGPQALLSRILEISTVGIIFFDPRGQIVQTNEHFLRMSGFSEEDVEAGLLSWTALTPPEWMPASLRAIKQLRTLGSTVPYEKEYFRKDGSRFRGLFAAKGVSADRGIEFILDITEQHDIRESLRKSEERFRRLNEYTPVGVFQADLDGQITYANPKVQEIFGMTERELMGNGWLTRLPADDAVRVTRHWAEAIEADRPYQVEYCLQMPNGTTRMVCAQSVMLHTEDGKPFGVVGTVEEITSRKQAEATVRETEKLIAVGRLAASIAHEINNPLESLTNLLYLARSSRNVDDIQQYLEVAERELRRVSAISSQTLRFHKQATNPTDARISDLLNEVIDVYQARLLNSHVAVERRCSPDLTIRCFDGEIRQVLSNLIGNAIDAMHPDGGRLVLHCHRASGRDGRPGVAIAVADTGTGMPRAVARKIFEAFYTTKGNNGTGLGLWISRDIVSRHHGTLSVRSSQREGKSGTVFRLFLPFDALNR